MPPEFDLHAFEAIFAERMQWASLQMPLQSLGEPVPDLLADLSRYEAKSAVALIAGLLTEPVYQSTTLRLELLVAFALVHCRGSVRPTLEDAGRWFATLGASPAAIGEDPAEDVFTTLVVTLQENFRLLEGLWESAGFYTQCVVDLVEHMPDHGIYGELKTDVRALLVVSELMCENAGVTRYQTGSERRWDEIDVAATAPAQVLRERVTLAFSDLAAREVSPEHLRPFLLPLSDVERLATQEPGLSDLDRHPLIEAVDGLIVALPTALSTALRDHVIDFAVATQQTDAFNRNYAQVLAEKIADTSLFGSIRGCRVQWREVGADRLALAVCTFDRGHYIVLHFVLPSVEMHEHGRFKHPISVSETTAEALDRAIASTSARVEASSQGFVAGLHLIVLCGWGQGMMLPTSRRDDPRWRYESIAIPDLIRLSNVDSMSVERFWRLEAALEALPAAGVEILSVNGVLNLLAWVELNDGHLVPHADLGDERISLDRPLMINPPLNLLRDLRARADQSTDLHVGVDVHGEPHRLQRTHSNHYFPHPADNRLYACLDCCQQGQLIAVCEGRPTVWLRIQTPYMTSSDVHYRLWDMLCAWMSRIVYAREPSGTSDGTMELVFHFHDVQSDLDRADALPPKDPSGLLSYELASDRTAIVSVGQGFMHAFRDPSNVAERALVGMALRAMLALGGEHDPNVKVAEWLPVIVPNDTGRHFHIMRAHELSDYVRARLPKEVLEVDDIDSAQLRLGLGWSVHEGANTVEGAIPCSTLLNRLVDVRVERVLGHVAQLDRAFLIKRLLLNHEAGHVKETHWVRTSAALLGLHGDTPATRRTVVEQLSRAAGAQITSRVLIEMALCAARTEDGRIPADLEIGLLLAEAALLIRLGGLSDGIYYGALEPRLKISPLGDILIEDSFNSDIVEPMLSTAMGERYVRMAGSQRRHYAAPEPQERTEHVLEPEFVQAWNAEMGFAIDEGRRMLDLLENRAMTQQEPVLTLPRSQLIALLATVSDDDKATRFVDRFSLVTRPKWDVPPAGFKTREILPWRFGRRLSVVARPLLQIDSANDPTYLLAPTLVRSGFFYLVRGAHNGTLDQEFFVSPLMRDIWWGKANEGHSFNADVAAKLRAGGWRAKENIELPTILQKKLERDYGDVDVLAWREGHDEVLVIECKDLSFRRNYSEIAALLSDYRGELKNGKPDKLLRHLNRVERLAKDLVGLGRHTGIGSPRVKSCLVVGGIVPMQFATLPALEQMFVGDVDGLLAEFSSSPDWPKGC